MYPRFKMKQVNIGEEIVRWVTFQRTVGTESDATLAKFLIKFLSKAPHTHTQYNCQIY